MSKLAILLLCLPTLASADCFYAGTAPFCAGSCPYSYAQCGSSKSGGGSKCLTGEKAYCCPPICPEGSEKKIGCFWDGTAPFCSGKCPDNYAECGRDDTGDGSKCATGTKAYCCPPKCPSSISINMTGDAQPPLVDDDERANYLRVHRA